MGVLTPQAARRSTPNSGDADLDNRDVGAEVGAEPVARAPLSLPCYAAILVAAVLSALLFAICVSSFSAFISSCKVSLSSFAASGMPS